MPEMPTVYLNRVTVKLSDDLNNALKQQAASRHISSEALIIDFIRLGLGLEPSLRLSADVIREMLTEEMKLYAVDAVNGITLLTQSTDKSVFADASLIARIVDDCIIIEHDQNDKPLVDALVQAGIPRAQIILAYAGEPIPEAT